MWSASPTRRSPPPSTSPSARCAAASTGAGPSCGAPSAEVPGDERAPPRRAQRPARRRAAPRRGIGGPPPPRRLRHLPGRAELHLPRPGRPAVAAARRAPPRPRRPVPPAAEAGAGHRGRRGGRGRRRRRRHDVGDRPQPRGHPQRRPDLPDPTRPGRDADRAPGHAGRLRGAGVAGVAAQDGVVRNERGPAGPVQRRRPPGRSRRAEGGARHVGHDGPGPIRRFGLCRPDARRPGPRRLLVGRGERPDLAGGAGRPHPGGRSDFGRRRRIGPAGAPAVRDPRRPAAAGVPRADRGPQRVAVSRSDLAGQRSLAAGPGNAPPLTLRCPAPHAVIDLVLEGILQAGRSDRTVGADLLGGFHPQSVAREEHGGVDVPAPASRHPLVVHHGSSQVSPYNDRRPVLVSVTTTATPTRPTRPTTTTTTTTTTRRRPRWTTTPPIRTTP